MADVRNVSVTVDADCGNAPRKAQVRDWLIALATRDLDTVCGQFDEDVRWDIAGEHTYAGIDAVRRNLEEATKEQVTRLTIRHLLSHGRQVAAEGETNNGRFAHLVTYTGHGKTAKITEIISYFASERE